MLLADQFEPKLKLYSVQRRKAAGARDAYFYGATLINRLKTPNASRKKGAFSLGRAKSRFSPPLRTATSAKPARPPKIRRPFHLSILPKPSFLPFETVPPLPRANNDAKTGENAPRVKAGSASGRRGGQTNPF
jgi:hypothetical protein